MTLGHATVAKLGTGVLAVAAVALVTTGGGAEATNCPTPKTPDPAPRPTQPAVAPSTSIVDVSPMLNTTTTTAPVVEPTTTLSVTTTTLFGTTTTTVAETTTTTTEPCEQVSSGVDPCCPTGEYDSAGDCLPCEETSAGCGPATSSEIQFANRRKGEAAGMFMAPSSIMVVDLR